ncbi:MAG: hypothetical protein H0V82_10750 [Candidatus Protochlamydia sp.]|nr:hypothetical protein [Candidatus Protochlamydia sp.]
MQNTNIFLNQNNSTRYNQNWYGDSDYKKGAKYYKKLSDVIILPSSNSSNQIINKMTKKH